jgi:hypothetical protein
MRYQVQHRDHNGRWAPSSFRAEQFPTILEAVKAACRFDPDGSFHGSGCRIFDLHEHKAVKVEGHPHHMED